MDPFTQKILEKAEKRSKIHGISKAPQIPLSEFNQIESSFPVQQSQVQDTVKSISDTSNQNQSSSVRRRYSVDVEEQVLNSSDNISEKELNEKTIKLRDCSRNRLQRLGALYSNADNLSSPVHRTENKFCEDNSAENLYTTESTAAKRPRQRIGKLVELADSIKSWEDDTTSHHSTMNTKQTEDEDKSGSQCRNYTVDSVANDESSDYHHQTIDIDDNQPTSSAANVIKTTTKSNIKQLKWDKAVIDSLEAQGFQRRESSSTEKLSYEYKKKTSNNTEHRVQIHNQQKFTKSDTGTDKESYNEQQLNKENPVKEIKSGLVSSKTAIFEKKSVQSPVKVKDPAEIPLKERMMLFERNKGKAPLPKTNYPITPKTQIKTDSKKCESHQITSNIRSGDIKDFPVGEVRVKDKLAALFAGPTTISESQIKANRTKQLREDMNLLANRFHSKNVEIATSSQSSYHNQMQDRTSSTKTIASTVTDSELVPPPAPPLPTTPLYDTLSRNVHVDAKCMISNKRKSPHATIERCDGDSKLSSEETKRVKMISTSSSSGGNSNKKRSGRLYPVLSDLETDNDNYTTATVSTASSCDDHKAHDVDDIESGEENDNESLIESDRENGIERVNVSLGREIMNIVQSNNLRNEKMNPRYNDPNTGFEYEDNSVNTSSAASIQSADSIGRGIDDYLDEALNTDNEDDNKENECPKMNKDNATTSSNSFYYHKRPKKQVHYKSESEEDESEKDSSEKQNYFSNDYHQKSKEKNQKENYKMPVKSELVLNSDDSNLVTLVHTVSFYRRQQSANNSNNSTPVRRIHHEVKIPSPSKNKPLNEYDDNNQDNDDDDDDEDDDNDNDNDNGDDNDSDCDLTQNAKQKYLVDEKIKRLLDEVCKQQHFIAQISRALNLCASTVEFSGSTEAVDGEKHLLVATHRRQAALDEIQRLKVEGRLRPIEAPKEKGRLSVRDIIVPLRDDYIRKLSADTITGHHLVCLLKYGEIVLATQTVPTLPGLLSVKFPDVLTFNKVYADFKITLEIYGMTAQREFLPHEVKYHINLNKKTPKKKNCNINGSDLKSIMPRIQSPAGPHVVRTPALVQYGFAIFSLREIQRDTWTLTQVSGVSPLKGIVQMKVNCEISIKVVHKGFLNIFEELSDFGAWRRRWCHLNDNLLSYWKYPNEEQTKPPLGSIDLYTCCSTKIAKAPRDICARRYTILLECQRPAKETDRESLLIIPKGNITIERHLLAADSDEELNEWCVYFNKTLTLLRAWNMQQ